MTMDKTAALMRIPCLRDLPKPLIVKLTDMAGIQRIGKGSTLFREGEQAHFVYALAEGCVSLVSGSPREETIAEFMDTGDIVLVPPALLGLPYMVTAKAVTDLVAILIPAAEFRHMAETELALSVSLNRLLAAHWRFLLRHLTQTKSRGADTRLARYLMDSVGAIHGAAHFLLPGSKKELAAHLGMTPATLSRSLKRLGRLGVKTKGADLEIEDIARLNELFQHSPHLPRHQPTMSVTR